MIILRNKRKINNNGITLIALVITIIVLLILAAVSIATLTGQNGILTRANDAKTETEDAKEDELRKLTQIEAATNIKNTDYYDSKGNKAIIPEGFAVSQVEGEQEIDTGLVIIDSEGNEFVWIPVSEYNIPYQKWCTTGYKYSVCSDDTLPTGITSESSQIDIYGGFWVARYESGKEYTDLVSIDTNNIDDSTMLRIEKGMQPWNFISYENAKKISENFICNDHVQSGLITGTQWDTIMKWLENSNIDVSNNCTNWGTYYDSTGYTINGVFSTSIDSPQSWLKGSFNKSSNGTLFTGTGLNPASAVKNIYDLAGNMWEWTSEIWTDRRICRGGNGNNRR